jgi:hypothetical protein
MRNDATAQNDPAIGGANRHPGFVATLARWPRIALHAAPPRTSRFATIKLINLVG